ncbi:hypothetical protein UFOVP53_236 [uncultured Caudovirales phage]|uniref:Uncharacterized protein n=1 Tax=uncultured Caudovirales phage TaxID=2100421 RepID=A0A6J5KXS7_9CAUD|nr:hypothetical protein UFOVP53_236 [uncultured Caudovirales phage]
MANFLRLVNGVPRSFSESGTVPIYNQSYTVAAPLTTGSPLTLPSSGSYTVTSGVTSLNIFLNGQKLIHTIDWNTSGAGPTYTAVVFTFDSLVGDIVEFREERNT